MVVPVAIFATALVVIATERVHRTKVALLGAVLMLLTQTIDQEQAIESIDFNTIGLLAGMMIMVKLTETTGVYTYLAIRAGQLSRGRPLAVVASLAVTTARALGVPGQPHDGAADGADHVPARRRARHRPDPAGDHRDRSRRTSAGPRR